MKSFLLLVFASLISLTSFADTYTRPTTTQGSLNLADGIHQPGKPPGDLLSVNPNVSKSCPYCKESVELADRETAGSSSNNQTSGHH